MKRIPIDKLQHKTTIGLQFKVFEAVDPRKQEQDSNFHRDDHYLFFILKRGLGTMKVDFQDIVVTARQIFYIIPSQIHSRINSESAEGWFLAVDP